MSGKGSENPQPGGGVSVADGVSGKARSPVGSRRRSSKFITGASGPGKDERSNRSHARVKGQKK